MSDTTVLSPRRTALGMVPRREHGRLPGQRKLQVGLGVLWLVDGALQLQPAMLGSAFARDVLLPAAAGQPGWVAEPVLHVARLVSFAPGPIDVVFALLQLALGAGLLLGWRTRGVLDASIAWSLAIWWLGEAFGGIFGGGATLLVGAPGGALLYAVVAGLAWPRLPAGAGAGAGAGLDPDGAAGAGTEGVPGVPRSGARAAWVGVWSLGALLSALPGASSARDVAGQVSAGAVGAPSWLAHLDHAVAHATVGAGSAVPALMVAVQVAIALAVLGPPALARLGLVSGVAVATAFWLVGQDLGAPWSGLATDVDLSPLVVLLALGVAEALLRSPRPASPPSVANWTPAAAAPLYARGDVQATSDGVRARLLLTSSSREGHSRL